MKINARIDRVVPSGKVKAIASVSLDGKFVVKNLKIIDGNHGLFVSMPQESYPGKDGKTKYSNVFFALTNAARTDLQDAVLDAYQQHLDPQHKQSQGSSQSSIPQGAGTSRNTIPRRSIPRNIRNPSTRSRGTLTGWRNATAARSWAIDQSKRHSRKTAVANIFQKG